MTLIRQLFIALIAAALALPLLSGMNSASAAPRGVQATVQRNHNDVVVRVANGKVSVEDDALVIRNHAGTLLDSYPLSFIAPDKRTYPIDAAVKGNVATLTPSTDAARSTATDSVLLARTEVADRNGYKSKQERDDAALARMNQELAAGGTISALVGTAIGAILGATLGFGCIAAGPAILVCVPLFAAVGGIIGTVVIGGPAAIASIIRYFDTINAPFVHVKPKKSR